eukprot:m.76079 g.76079  ORF g.76079 m.76079 type:complete len:394 (+) comp35965_c0_seq19:20-1201(+)
MEEENSFMGEPAFEMDAKERESDVKIEPAFESGNKPKQPVKLKKSITVLHAVGMMAGGIIGSGIFFTPHAIFKLSGSVGMAMLVWVGSGLLALGGGLCYCELGVSFPESGGEYVYLHAAFGPFAGFLFLWMTVLLIRPVSQAAITLAFALHIAEPFYEQGCEPEPIVVSLIGIALTVFLAILNVRSVKGAVFLQSWLTVFKVIALIAIVALAIFQLARGDSGSLTEGFSHTTPSVGKVGLAFYQSLWAYDGWNALNYVAEEIPNPSKWDHTVTSSCCTCISILVTKESSSRCGLSCLVSHHLLLDNQHCLLLTSYKSGVFVNSSHCSTYWWKDVGNSWSCYCTSGSSSLMSWSLLCFTLYSFKVVKSAELSCTRITTTQLSTVIKNDMITLPK